MNKTIYKGYEITESSHFLGFWRIVSPSKKFISLSTSLDNAKKQINEEINILLEKEPKLKILVSDFMEHLECRKGEDIFPVSIVIGEYEIVYMTEKELDNFTGDWVDINAYAKLGGEIVFRKAL